MIRSPQFIEGYGACDKGISRTRNPYPEIVVNTNGQERANYQWDHWRDGWNTRFFGEALYEGTPDP